MRASRTPGQLLVMLMAVATLRCAYAPDPASGTLKCSVSTMECPEGYACDGTFCNKKSATDGGQTGAAGDGGSDGVAKFVGHWIYDTGSTETVDCTDGSNKENDLGADYVDVAMSGTGLTADYFCVWDLTLGPVGTGTVLQPGQSCSRSMTDATTGVTKFTWHGSTFTMKTAEGKKATLSATIAVDYVDDPTKTSCSPTTTPCAGSCTIKIDATLTKS
jgi:hypothetical protein